MEQGAIRRSVGGTPQGGVVSSLLANVYLNRLDREWRRRATGTLVRYADDLVVICRSKDEARHALSTLRAILAELGLQLKREKTRIVASGGGRRGLISSAFTIAGCAPVARARGTSPSSPAIPSRKAKAHACERIRELTARERLALPVEQIVRELNWCQRGWAGYFRYGNSARPFDKVGRHAINRLALFVASGTSARRNGAGRRSSTSPPI
jgi:RNA-directed DNA polymerase